MIYEYARKHKAKKIIPNSNNKNGSIKLYSNKYFSVVSNNALHVHDIKVKPKFINFSDISSLFFIIFVLNNAIEQNDIIIKETI